jgi:Kef-type K+ transport system membrane component KefB
VRPSYHGQRRQVGRHDAGRPRGGFDWRTSGTLGLPMNTRGLIELIVLTIGRDMGILSPELFGLMVLMAIGTTMATWPLLPLMAPPNSRNLASGAVAGTS